MSQVGPARLSKEEVNYRQHEQCSTCMFFYPLNSCSLVEGNISPEAVCDKWQIQAPSRPRDGEFFLEEFEKTKR